MFHAVTLDAHNPSPMTGAGNHTYLLADAAGSAVLIDAGVGNARHLASIAECLAEHQATLGQVLVTHGHSDHVSGVASLRRTYSAAAFCKFPWPAEDARHPVPWTPLRDGDRVVVGSGDTDVLVTLHTPGHSPDHLAFWHEATATIWSGDLVVAGSSVMIAASHGGDLNDYLASLRRLLSLSPARLLPAHGPEIVDPAPLVRAYIGHRLVREQQVVAALAAGRDTVPAIAESIYDGLSAELLAAAQENVLAHLRKLQRETRAVEEDGRWRSSGA